MCFHSTGKKEVTPKKKSGSKKGRVGQPPSSEVIGKLLVKLEEDKKESAVCSKKATERGGNAY